MDIERISCTKKRAVFFSLSLVFASIPILLFADFLWRIGFGKFEGFLLFVFSILACNLAWGTTHAVVGFWVRRMVGKKRFSFSEGNGNSEISESATVAIVLPVYNEDPIRVFAGLRAMYESLLATGQSDRFDFFILSDSTNPERWVEEEHAWATLCRNLNAFGRINYRRRLINKDRKAGNLLEFCESWGQRYRYMVTLDADSILEGDTLVEMVRLMESNPRAGIVQTAPTIVYGDSFWGRVQQFANRFYGPVFQSGLWFWQQDAGNYWGHNAIIRLAPFMEFCALPDLPGREPFGGKILSHDFVEAALMRRAGYEVWLATGLGGSFEECPQDIIEHAKRDRRWCQGNMQHVWLLFSPGLSTVSRIHLANGIMGYAGSLIWLVFIVLGGISTFNRVRSQLTMLPVSGLTNVFEMSLQVHAFLIFCITVAMLFIPKILALVDSLWSGTSKEFGGIFGAFGSVVLESVVSFFAAPIFMLYHSQFVVFTALGKGVSWSTQKRGAGDGLAISDAVRAHWMQSLFGLAVGFFSYRISAAFFLWLSPVWGSLFLSPLISYVLSKPSLGRFWRSCKLLLIPEERNPPQTIESTKRIEQEVRGANWLFDEETSVCGFINSVVDPYVNAIRVTLAEGSGNEAPEDTKLIETKALERGPDSLSERQLKRILMSPDALLRLHRAIWTMNPQELHEQWGPFIERYGPSMKMASA